MLLEISLYVVLSIVVISLLILYFKIIRPEKRIYDSFRAQGINGEPFVPLIGQMPEIRYYRKYDSYMNFQENLMKKHGNTFLFGFGPVIRLVITEPELLADILSRANAQNYTKPPIYKTVFDPIIGKQNLLVAEGYEHERARRMINPAFYHTHLKSMISIIVSQTNKAIQNLLQASTCNLEQTVPIDLQREFNALTLSVIASSAFGSGFETITNAQKILYQTFTDVLDAIVYRSSRMIIQIPFLSKLPFWKKDVVDNGARLVAELVDQIIIERRQGLSKSLSDGSDLLDLLLSAVDDEKRPFTDQQIKEHALTFVLAGSDTTGNLMTWLFYVLMTHEDVYEACREEVDRILSNDEEITNEILSQLVVCEAVINETLRLYPPAPIFTRHCIREHTIGSKHPIHVPAGATIIVNSYLLHRRQDIWLNAGRFDYTRWMRDPKTDLKPKLPNPYAYLPFASGTRNCIGQNFALLETKIILAMFIQRCHFKMMPGQKIVPDFVITMRMKYGLLAKVKKR